MGESDKLLDFALEISGVGADFIGKVVNSVRRDINPPLLGFLQNKSGSHLNVGWLDVNSKTAHKAGDETIFQAFDFTRFAIRGENDLAIAKVKRIEGVEEFLLGIFLAGDELDVVDQNTVNVTVFIFELIDIFGTESRNKFVAEGFGGKVTDFEIRIVFKKLPANGLHQMGFANPDATPNKERVVGKAGVFDDALGGGKGEIVTVANDQIIEGVFGMEAGVKLRGFWDI